MSLRRRAYAPPVPKMPPGLVELMDGLARDVLKNNPEKIFEFCAHHMQTLLTLRDGNKAPKPLLTLEQKIAKAQQKINERAEQRRREYDEKLQFPTSQSYNKQHVLPSSNIVDDSESPEIKEIENKSIEVKEEEKDETINPIEQSEIEKRNSDNYTDLETNDKEDNLHLCADDEIKDDKDIANLDTLDVIDSDQNETIILVKEGGNIETTTEINVNNEDLKNNPSEENHIVTSKELQTVVINLDTETEDKKEVNNTLTSIQNTLDTHLEGNVISDEKVITTKQDNSLESQNEGTEIGNEINMQTEIDDIVVKDESDEIIEIGNDITEKETSPPIDSFSKETTKVNNDVHADQYEMQTDSPPVNMLKEDCDETVFDPKKDSSEICKEDLNEPEIRQEDDKILAVILSTKSPEPDFVDTNELDPVQNNGYNLKKEEILDIESTSEPTDDKTRTMNSSMDLETAAITIQKVFRSFLFKTKTASYDDPTTVDMNLLNEDKEKEERNELNINIKDRRLLGISRMDTVLQTVNEEKSLSLSTDDSSLSSAATIIQAHVRGFLVRNKTNLNKTTSSYSLIDSDVPSIPSLEADSDNRKSKTVLNIHIVPEGGHFVSRDESILTSMDLSLDSSPPSSVNLHPLGYDKSERRKLKREDAIQSVSPPSNNSGKLSDDFDSEKEVLTVTNNTALGQTILEDKNAINNVSHIFTNGADKAAKKDNSIIENPASDAADEMDVITPFVPIEGRSSRESDNSSKLLHSGEFHDIVVPTNVTRSDTSVVREFQNVLVYFILWNN